MVGEIQVYDSRPLSGSVKGILILFPDGFGLASHNQLLADMFAERGWTTIIPDYFEGKHGFLVRRMGILAKLRDLG
jgi:dienelactone hydrolase